MADPTDPDRRAGLGLNEDWLATIVGLALLVVALVGIIPAGIVP